MQPNISLLTMRCLEQRKVSHISVEMKLCRKTYLQCYKGFPILGTSDTVGLEDQQSSQAMRYAAPLHVIAVRYDSSSPSTMWILVPP